MAAVNALVIILCSLLIATYFVLGLAALEAVPW
jgi:hypothetical protein